MYSQFMMCGQKNIKKSISISTKWIKLFHYLVWHCNTSWFGGCGSHCFRGWPCVHLEG